MPHQFLNDVGDEVALAEVDVAVGTRDFVGVVDEREVGEILPQVRHQRRVRLS